MFSCEDSAAREEGAQRKATEGKKAGKRRERPPNSILEEFRKRLRQNGNECVRVTDVHNDLKKSGRATSRYSAAWEAVTDSLVGGPGSAREFEKVPNVGVRLSKAGWEKALGSAPSTEDGGLRGGGGSEGVADPSGGGRGARRKWRAG